MTAPIPNADQRDALEESEKDAAAPQPENYKEQETDDKVVEIGPDMTDAPIKGIDPDERSDAQK